MPPQPPEEDKPEDEPAENEPAPTHGTQPSVEKLETVLRALQQARASTLEEFKRIDIQYAVLAKQREPLKRELSHLNESIEDVRKRIGVVSKPALRPPSRRHQDRFPQEKEAVLAEALRRAKAGESRRSISRDLRLSGRDLYAVLRAAGEPVGPRVATGSRSATPTPPSSPASERQAQVQAAKARGLLE